MGSSQRTPTQKPTRCPLMSHPEHWPHPEGDVLEQLCLGTEGSRGLESTRGSTHQGLPHVSLLSKDRCWAKARKKQSLGQGSKHPVEGAPATPAEQVPLHCRDHPTGVSQP